MRKIYSEKFKNTFDVVYLSSTGVFIRKGLDRTAIYAKSQKYWESCEVLITIDFFMYKCFWSGVSLSKSRVR